MGFSGTRREDTSVTFHRRYTAGMGGICLGNACLAVALVLDGSLLGPMTTIAAVGAAVVLGVAITDPGSFTFEGSTAARITPSAVLAGGAATTLAGALVLGLLLVG